MAQLPGFANAVVADAKITDYLLNDAHPNNGGKAKSLTRNVAANLNKGIVALAKAGVQGHRPNTCSPWVPAFAGMREFWWDTDSVEFISGRALSSSWRLGSLPRTGKN